MTITHSPCCPILNVAEIMLLDVINVTLLNRFYGPSMMSQEKTPEKRPQWSIASVVAFWKDPANFNLE